MSEQETMFGVPSVAPDMIVNRTERLRRTGYAREPGSGPEGETCKTCDHLIRREWAKTYFKCHLVIGDKQTGTHGAGTDIRCGSPACSEWKPEE